MYSPEQNQLVCMVGEWYVLDIFVCVSLNVVVVTVQEENELHERLAELKRKERYLMGRDQARQQEQGIETE